jgi:hypothetical protein
MLSSSCALLTVVVLLVAGSFSTPTYWGLTLPTVDAAETSTAYLSRCRHHHGLLNSLLHTRGGSLPSANPSDGEAASTSSTTSTATGIEASKDSNDSDEYEIVSDEVLHDHWRRLIRRSVRLPGNKSNVVVDFEIVAQKGTDQAVLIFCWNTATKRATLIREYMPSTHCRMMGLAAGMVEDDKHGNDGGAGSDETTGDYVDDMRLTAAKHELEEECRLVGGTWMRLTEDGVVMDKYSTTRLSVYLVLDPEPVHEDDAKPRDAEEDIQVVPGVSIDEIRGMIVAGRMTVVGGWASLLALQKLRELGEIED